MIRETSLMQLLDPSSPSIAKIELLVTDTEKGGGESGSLSQKVRRPLK